MLQETLITVLLAELVVLNAALLVKAIGPLRKAQSTPLAQAEQQARDEQAEQQARAKVGRLGW